MRKVALLILFAYEQGYELTWGAALKKSGHKKNSLHYCGLAVDFNLFKDGKYLTETKDHELLGAFWETLDGSWGGHFGDGNHYELKRPQQE